MFRQFKWLGVVHKGRPHSGGEGYVQCRHLADKGGGGVLQIRTSALFDVKNFRFFKIYGVPARTRGREVETVRTFFELGVERGSIFRDFVRTSFMDGPLGKSEITIFFHFTAIF